MASHLPVCWTCLTLLPSTHPMPKTCTSCGTTYPDTMVFCPTDGTSLRLDEAGGDLIGAVIAGRYLVSKLLGEGGLGKVYLARHVRLPQQAAIKVLHHDMVKDQGAVARFNREAENAARIEHDRVARVFDFGETPEGLVYLAMEFVPGKTLRDILNDEQRLSAVRAANIVYQVAEGLDAAHRLSIVHRDLKPDNILVMSDEGVDRCKVVDFGIAKVTNDSGTQLTQTGMLVGTPEFMSPEQVLGEKLDGRSDVYALALVAFEMFTGLLPFEGTTPERKLTARLIQDPKTLVNAAPDIEWPSELQAAFTHALMREPDERTSSALAFGDAVVSAVEAWLSVPVLRSRTPLSSTTITASANESTAAMAKPGGASLPTPRVTAAAPAPRAFTPGAGTSASKEAIPEPSKSKAPMAAIGALVVVLLAGGGYFALRGTAGGEAPAAAIDAPAAATPGNIAQGAAPTSARSQNPGDARSTGTAAGGPAASGRPTEPPAPSGGASPNAKGTEVAPAVAVQATDANSADAAEASRTLTGLKASLNNAAEDEASDVALKLIPQFNRLLPRLGNAVDSTWAYHALAMAYSYSDQLAAACRPLREAKRLASTSQQREAVKLLADQLTCAP